MAAASCLLCLELAPEGAREPQPPGFWRQLRLRQPGASRVLSLQQNHSPSPAARSAPASFAGLCEVGEGPAVTERV